jgi:hypothetical protein
MRCARPARPRWCRIRTWRWSPARRLAGQPQDHARRLEHGHAVHALGQRQ